MSIFARLNRAANTLNSLTGGGIRDMAGLDEKFSSMLREQIDGRDSRVDKRLTPQAPHRTVRASFTHTAPHSNIHF